MSLLSFASEAVDVTIRSISVHISISFRMNFVVLIRPFGDSVAEWLKQDRINSIHLIRYIEYIPCYTRCEDGMQANFQFLLRVPQLESIANERLEFAYTTEVNAREVHKNWSSKYIMQGTEPFTTGQPPQPFFM